MTTAATGHDTGTKGLSHLALGYPHYAVRGSLVVHADCFRWLERIPPDSIHAIVTDPPYGVKEFETEQLEKRANGNGGIWRIPPSFDGYERAPLPRFTALNSRERTALREFFVSWSRLAVRVLRPGGHVFIASNSFLSQLVFAALVEGGLEFRGQVIRAVRTLRGGNRPKNAETEFPMVSSMPRGCFEPWGLLRKPLPSGVTLGGCLRLFQTGGIRRYPNGSPFCDVIPSERTPQVERAAADHPSVKPQSLLRHLMYAALPLGEGIVLDPFMGSGSTVAAAIAVNTSCIGVEKHDPYYETSKRAIPKLAALPSSFESNLQLVLLD